MLLSEKIKAESLRLGFDACGIAKAECLTLEMTRLQQWVMKGAHGEMLFMEKHGTLRANPQELLPGCQSFVMVLLNYKPEAVQIGRAHV